MKYLSLALLCVFGLDSCCACRKGSAPARTTATQNPEAAAPVKTASAGEPETPSRLEGANPVQGAASAQAPARVDKKVKTAAVDASHVAPAHADALSWLVAHQQSDGSWKGDEQAQVNQIGLTGLALLALQSEGSTMTTGAHAQPIARAVKWLQSQQDADLGLIGQRVGHAFAYNHAIATQALCVALRDAPDAALKKTSQYAINFISQMRNPYGAWRYSYPPTGDSDTSVTGWMVEAIVAAQAAGLEIDEQALVGARQWVDDVTDPTTARVGYDSVGSSSSRVGGLNDQFPVDQHEAMTASGMLTRINSGHTTDPILPKQAELLKRHPPEWDPESKLVDEYYWYFGSLAMKRVGGSSWDIWRESAQTALLTGQQREGAEKGSWDPLGPWGYAGGRVYATSLNALSLSTML